MKVDEKATCCWCELNPQPLHYAGVALPLALQQQLFLRPHSLVFIRGVQIPNRRFWIESRKESQMLNQILNIKKFNTKFYAYKFCARQKSMVLYVLRSLLTLCNNVSSYQYLRYLGMEMYGMAYSQWREHHISMPALITPFAHKGLVNSFVDKMSIE